MTNTAGTPFIAALQAAVAPIGVRTGVPLGAMTTFKVGGAAEVFVEPETAAQVTAAVTTATRHGVAVTMLGGGSNVLVADAGVRGLVIRRRGGGIGPVGADLVRADAPVTINGLVRWTIAHGYAGLEAWAGTPGTVGGAIHGNAHWKGANIGEQIESVRLLRRDGTLLQVSADRMDFGYDRSRLQRSGEILLWAAFRLEPGHPPDALRAVARESLAFRKRTQPLGMPSAGCVFQNPDPVTDVLPPDVPRSAGALVERAGLKGARCGGALVSPVHANFLVTDGTATATEVRLLIERCRSAVLAQTGVRLRDEVVYLGDWGDGPWTGPSTP